MRPGRPRLDPDDTTVAVCVKLSAARYDAIYAQARRERVSIPELLRRALAASVAPRRRTRRPSDVSDK